MAAWEHELVSLLEREKSLLEDLEKYSREKTDILATGDVDGLSKMVNKEQPLIMQLETFEDRREELMEKYGLCGKTLADICEIAATEYKNVLETKLEALREITNKIKKRNDLNNQLTKSRLEFYGKMRSLIAKPLYGYNGVVSQKSVDGVSLIDRKI